MIVDQEDIPRKIVSRSIVPPRTRTMTVEGRGLEEWQIRRLSAQTCPSGAGS